MGVRHFGDRTYWDVWDLRKGTEGWSQPGWALPSDPSRYISRSDPYWARVLQEARRTYGDPDIHYSTDDTADGRHLVFGDGVALPRDGLVVYHDAATKQSWAQNDDGTVSFVGPDGQPGPPRSPTGYRRIGERYAPVDDHGQQVGPQLGGIPGNDNGFHTDPVTGALTPKNANGDYYTLAPDGTKSYFDRSGAPIPADAFTHPSAPRDGGGAPPPGPAQDTAEQQSGKAADAVKRLQQELKNRYSTISDAEEKLSQVLLDAHATTAAGRQKLNDIQTRIVEAVGNPAMATDTPAGERAFLTFLRNQVGQINDLLTLGALTAEDQGKAAQALAALYAADPGATAPADPAPPSSPEAPPAQAPVAPAPPPAGADPAAPQAPDPGLPDLPSGGPLGMPMGADPLSSLASMLPAMSGLGAGASPLDSLGGLAGAAAPLAGLASPPADHPDRQPAPDTSQDTAPRAAGTDHHADKADPATTDTATPSGGATHPSGPPVQNPDGAPPGLPAPAPASAAVTLPDGSTATARTPQAAQAIRDYLAGDTVDAAYRKNGIPLPPPGTPITHPVDPSRLTCGDLAMFKDHYVPALSAVKAYLNGQVVPLGSVATSPDFLGWIDPTAAAGSTAPAGAPAPPTSPAAAPPPAALPAG